MPEGIIQKQEPYLEWQYGEGVLRLTLGRDERYGTVITGMVLRASDGRSIDIFSLLAKGIVVHVSDGVAHPEYSRFGNVIHMPPMAPALFLPVLLHENGHAHQSEDPFLDDVASGGAIHSSIELSIPYVSSGIALRAIVPYLEREGLPVPKQFREFEWYDRNHDTIFGKKVRARAVRVARAIAERDATRRALEWMTQIERTTGIRSPIVVPKSAFDKAYMPHLQSLRTGVARNMPLTGKRAMTVLLREHGPDRQQCHKSVKAILSEIQGEKDTLSRLVSLFQFWDSDTGDFLYKK